MDNYEKKAVNQEQFTVLEKTLLSENKRLKGELVKLEEYSRRNNLLFHGIEERDGEVCEELIQSFLVDKLLFSPSDRHIAISTAHTKKR